jgi:cryptochrome
MPFIPNFIQGGELKAIKFFNQRIQFETEAFLDGSFLPNRRDPDILNPPKSLSPDLKFGCLSVKRFYWAIMDAFQQVSSKKSVSTSKL